MFVIIGMEFIWGSVDVTDVLRLRVEDAATLVDTNLVVHALLDVGDSVVAGRILVEDIGTCVVEII